MKRALHSLWHDRRGSASIEAAVILPIMALCWAGLFLRFEGIEAFMDAAVEARRDAWTFSAQGCEVDDGDPPEPANTDVRCLLDDGNDHNMSWTDVLAKIPFVGFLVETITGFQLEKTAIRPHRAPPLLGGGSSDVAYNYTLMCNEKSRSATEILGACLCQAVHSLGLSFDFAFPCPGQPPRASHCN